MRAFAVAFALVAMMAATAVASTPPDEQFFGVRLAAGKVRPSQPALMTALNPLVANSQVQVSMRDPSRAGAKWTYEFAFTGATAPAYFEAFVALKPAQEAAKLNATYVSAVLPPDAFFFAVWAGVAANESTLVGYLHAVAPALPEPEVVLRAPSQGTARWAYEFAFAGPNASAYMDAFVSLTPQQEAAIVHATRVAALVPPDTLFFEVRQPNTTMWLPTSQAIATALNQKLLPAFRPPELYLRASTVPGAAINSYEFAILGNDAARYVDALGSLSAQARAALLNATYCGPRYPPDSAFYLVWLNVTTVPTATEVAGMVASLVPGKSAEIVVRKSPSYTYGHWTYQFAFYGPSGSQFFDAYSSLTMAEKARMLHAVDVEHLVLPDAFYLQVWLQPGVKTPTALQLAQTLAPLVNTSGLPDVLMVLPPPESSQRWSYAFSCGANSIDYQGAFQALSTAQQLAMLHAVKIAVYNTPYTPFFSVWLPLKAILPTDAQVSAKIAALDTSLPAPEVFIQKPTGGKSTHWAYEFTFIGPDEAHWQNLFASLSAANMQAILTPATQVALRDPPDLLIFAAYGPNTTTIPDDAAIAFALRNLVVGEQPPEIVTPWFRKDKYHRRLYQFAFVGPTASVYLAAFQKLSPYAAGRVLGVTAVYAIVPPDETFIYVQMTPPAFAPSPSVVSDALQRFSPTGLPPEIYQRVPSTGHQFSWTYEFAFVGPSADATFESFIGSAESWRNIVLNASATGVIVPADAYFFEVRLLKGHTAPTEAELARQIQFLDTNLTVEGGPPAVLVRPASSNRWSYEFAFVGPTANEWMPLFVKLSAGTVEGKLNASYVGAMVPPDTFFFQGRIRFGGRVPTTAALEWSLSLPAPKGLGLAVEVYSRAAPPGRRWAYEFAFVGPNAAAAFAAYVQLTPRAEANVVNASFVGPIVPPVGYFGVWLRDGFTVPTTAVLEATLQRLSLGDTTFLAEAYQRMPVAASGEDFSYAFACVGPDASMCTQAVKSGASSANELRLLNATRIVDLGALPTPSPSPQPSPPGGPAPPDHHPSKGGLIAVILVVTLVVFGAIMAVGYLFHQKRARRRAHVALMDPGHVQHFDETSEVSSARASMATGVGSESPAIPAGGYGHYGSA